MKNPEEMTQCNHWCSNKIDYIVLKQNSSLLSVLLYPMKCWNNSKKSMLEFKIQQLHTTK